MGLEINMKKTKRIFPAWLQPPFGGSAINCSSCGGIDYTVHSLVNKMRCNNCRLDQFAVHVFVKGKNSAAISEFICIGCLTQTKVDDQGMVLGKDIMGIQCTGCKSKTLLEKGAVIDRRGELINKKSKRRLNNGK